MGRRRPGVNPYGYDIEPWTAALGPFYRIPTEKELAVRADYEKRAAALIEKRFGRDSDIAAMLGLAAAPVLAVAA